MPVALSEADRVRLLEEIAQDMSVKATQRLRALEELGRIQGRRASVSGSEDDDADRVAPDPMAMLDVAWADELEQRRLRRTA